MKKTIAKITAVLSTAVLCALPMASNLTANAATIKYGDVNYDNKLTMSDVLIIADWSSHNMSTIDRTVADCNKDGVINAFDSKMVQRAILNGKSYISEVDRNKIGDANDDGDVDAFDQNFMIDILWDGESDGLTPAVINNSKALLARFDVDSNGVFNWADATTMMCYSIYNYYFDRNFTELVKRGDANNDGAVTSADLTTIAKYVARSSFNINKENADYNKDGKVDYADYAQIKAAFNL